MESYKELDSEFVKKFLLSIYVDDVSLGAESVNSAYDLYLKSKTRLAEAGFTLCKFVTNSDELREKIEDNESLTPVVVSTNPKEDNLSYAKSCLGVSTSGASEETHKILGVQWNPRRDVFVFDITDVTRSHCNLQRGMS